MKLAHCGNLTLIPFAVLWVLLVGFMGCDSSEEVVEPERCEFAGITKTDEQGMAISVDPSDWCVEVGDPPYITMAPAYPNPATSTTSIKFSVSDECRVRMKIVSESCDTVRTLVDDIFSPAGAGWTMVWDLRDDSAQPLPKGIFRCYMLANGLECQGDIEIK